MIRQPIRGKWVILLGAASIAVLVALYTYISHAQHVKNPRDTTIPGWSQMAGGVASLLAADARSGERWILVDAVATLRRLALGLLFGVSGALVLGMLMGCYGWIEAIFNPPMAILAKVPPTAALAVFFVLAGTGTNMYVVMIAFGILPTLAQTVQLAVKDVPIDLLHKVRTLGASQCEEMLCVIFRHVLPKLIDAMRLQIGPAVVYLIAAEMLVGDVGFGYRIRLQGRLLNMSVVYPYIAVLAAFGFGMDHALRWVHRRLCPWNVHEKE